MTKMSIIFCDSQGDTRNLGIAIDDCEIREMLIDQGLEMSAIEHLIKHRTWSDPADLGYRYELRPA